MESQDDQKFVVGVDPRALRHVEDLDAQNNAAEGTEFQSMTPITDEAVQGTVQSSAQASQDHGSQTRTYTEVEALEGVLNCADFIKGQTKSFKEEVRAIADNIRKEVGVSGYDSIDGVREEERLYVAIVDPVAEHMLKTYREDFHMLAKKPLSKSIVLGFLLATSVMAEFNTSRSHYLSDADSERPHFVHNATGISKEDYDTLFQLLDRPDPKRKGSGKYNLPATGSSEVKAMFEVVGKTLRSLVHGCNNVVLGLDDLQVSGNSKKLRDDGYTVHYNQRKASVNGVEIDVITHGLSRIPVGLVLMDASDDLNGVIRSDAIVATIDEIAAELELTPENVIVVADRGFESTQIRLIEKGYHLLGTSKKGGFSNKQVPFTYDQPEDKAKALAPFMKNVVYQNQGRAPFVQVFENKIHGRSVFHFAFFSRVNVAPALMKTTLRSLCGRIIVYPKHGSDARDLVRADVPTASTTPDAHHDNQQSSSASDARFASLVAASALVADTPIQQSTPLSTSATTPLSTNSTLTSSSTAVGNVIERFGVSHAASSTSEDPINRNVIDDASRMTLENEARTIFEGISKAMVILTTTQRTAQWYVVRWALTSTSYEEIMVWLSNLKQKAFLEGRDEVDLLTLAAAMPKEDDFTAYEASFDPSTAPWMSRAQRIDMSDYSDINGHADFLWFIGKRSNYNPPDLSRVTGGAIDSATPRELLDAAAYLKVPNRPHKPKGRATYSPSDEEKAALLQSVKTALNNKAESIKIDLAGRLIKRWNTIFAGSAATRLGHFLEDEVAKNLHRDLPHVQFVDNDGDGSAFDFVSHVATTGCVAPATGSACVASTDGFFVARAKGELNLQPYVLEVKTKVSKDELAKAHRVQGNRKFYISDEMTETERDQLFEYVLGADYVYQALHHCAATGIPRLLHVIVDGIKGDLIRFSLLEFDEQLLQRHRLFIDFIAYHFLPFLSRPTSRSWNDMTAERINYICRLRHLLLKADIDYVERYILPLPICSYNLYKSGSDMLHKEMLPLTHLATGTHRKMSISALMIMQVTAFRMIKMTMALKKLETADTVEHMLDIINDERAIGELALDLGLYMNPSRFCSRPQRIVSAVRPRNDLPSETYRPDLPEYRLRMAKLRDLAVSKQGNTVIPANATPVGVSKIAQPFILNSELSEVRTRSHHMLQHSVVVRNHRTERGSCDICCMDCEGEMKKGNSPKDDHPRDAYRASTKCSFCQVNLCIVKRRIWGGKTCYEWFHSQIAKEAFNHPFTHICTMAEDVKDEAHPDIISRTPLEHARLVRRTRDDASQSTGNVAQSLSSSAARQQHDSTIRKLQFHSASENKSKRARRDK